MQRPSITPLHPIVQILIRNSPKSLVIQTGQTQSFPKIFLEILNSHQFLSQSRLPLTTGGSKKFLETAVRQSADFITHDDTRPHADARETTLTRLQNTGNSGTLNPRSATTRLNSKALSTCLGKMVVKTQDFRAHGTEKHIGPL